MYPKDNIFNIYYNIGRRLPFHVKRCEIGLARSKDEETMYSPKGRSFIVERIETRGKYGKAYGICLVDGKPNNEYRENRHPEITNDEIPCAGCGEWILLDVPGCDMNEIFPTRSPDYIINFGKHKGKTIKEIYAENPQYIYWLMSKDHYFKVNFDQLLNIPDNSPDRETIIANEFRRVFPKITPDDLITFGKHKGKTFREVFAFDPNYVKWLIRQDSTLEIDTDSFAAMLKQQLPDSNN